MKKMNRKQILTLTAALALTALTACSSLPASAASVDYDTAVKIAADHLGCDVSDLKVIERDYDDGKYELDILVGDVKYEYEIGASSGKVLKAERDRRDWDDRYDDDWDDRYDDDWDDRYDDDWDDRYDDDWDDRYDDDWDDRWDD